MAKLGKTERQILSIKAQGPMLDVLIHCKTETQTIKKLKELKNLVSPPKKKIVDYYKTKWQTKRSVYYVDNTLGKINGKHHFEIIHNHPQHPFNN